MCQFITAFLPGSANLTTAATTFDKHEVGFRQIDNPRVLAQLPSGEVFILTTRGHCDCGTPLGSQGHSHTTAQSGIDHQSDKLRRIGWSEAKIHRWQDQKEMDERKRQRAEHSHAVNSTPQIAQWIAFISDLLHSRQTDRIGLLLHSGHDIESGRLEIVGQEWVGLPELTVDHLLHIQKDTLYSYYL